MNEELVRLIVREEVLRVFSAATAGTATAIESFSNDPRFASVKGAFMADGVSLVEFGKQIIKAVGER